jgi:segregation and condensation protein A
VRFTATLLDLMQAYARIRTRDDFRPYVMDRHDVLTMEQALDRMRPLIGFAGDWTDLPPICPTAGRRTRCGGGPPRRRPSRPRSSLPRRAGSS